uniref:E3 ubiquitin-protein ligase RMA n=1 Tax=Quercus lobata TaxID=97700 RepID=A0A7N2MYX1_QUELO
MGRTLSMHNGVRVSVDGWKLVVGFVNDSKGFEVAKVVMVGCMELECGHLFCWFCLCSWLKSFSKCKECPVCRAIIEEDKLVPLYGTESEREDAKDLDPNSEKSIPNRPMAPRPQTATLPNNEDYFPEDEDDFSEDEEDLNIVYPAISTSCNPPLYYQIRPPRWIETPFLPLGAMVVQGLRKKKGFWDPAKVPEVRILGQRFCEDRQRIKESWLRYYSKYRECPVCRAVIKEYRLVPLYGIESRGKEAKDLDYVPKF